MEQATDRSDWPRVCRHRAALLASLLVGLAGAWLAAPQASPDSRVLPAPLSGPPAIRILDERGRVLATVAVPGGFTLTFIHSINISPVDECFFVGQDGVLVLDRMLYNQMSTGMPFDDADGFAVEGGRFVVRPGRRLPQLALRISPVAGHSLTAQGRTRPLTRWGQAGDLLVIRGLAGSGG